MNMGRWCLHVFGAALLMGGVVGCKGSDPPLGTDVCETDEDCADDLKCDDGLCIEPDKPDTPDVPPDTPDVPPVVKAGYTEKCGKDADCKTGLSCIKTESHGSICTRLCPPDGSGDVCDDPSAEIDMECLTMRPSGGDLVSICYPRAQTYCQSCERDGEDITGGCGTVGADLCLTQTDGNFCAVDCAEGKSCPDGAECSLVLEGEVEYMVCVPEEGRCLDCIDLDGDGYGQAGRNSECRFQGDDCDDTNPDVHPGAISVCDGQDTSCKGRVDSDYTTEDGVYYTISHCGACGVDCYGPNVAVAECGVDNGAAGCVIVACNEGFADCDGDPSNGCEADLSKAANCGGCGNICGGSAVSTDSSTCERLAEGEDRFACEVVCNPGFADCNGSAADGCEADLTNPTTCGTCGNSCDDTFDNAEGACLNQQCRMQDCAAGFADCNNDPSDGCEADLNDESNCGACGVVCGDQNTIVASTCEQGATPQENACDLTCAGGYQNCNGIPNDGCEVNTMTDSNNCSACGVSCGYANADSACTTGACQFNGCHDDFGDCDGDMGVAGAMYPAGTPKTGCEQPLLDNDEHCGVCANDCTAISGDWICEETICMAQECGANQLDCPADGGQCESDRRDPTTCGNCTTNCLSTPNVASATCSPDSTTRCAITACTAPFADCNGQHSDGCEVNTNTHVNNCGGCGTKCELPNSVMECANGSCAFVECLPGWMNLEGTENTVGCDYQCTVEGGEDRPDDFTVTGYNWQHKDTNCDGIDGDIERALFVDTLTGNDNHPGTMTQPLKTVNAALAEISSLPNVDQIYVSEGVYNERVHLIRGISIYGGFKAADGWKRSASNKSKLRNIVADSATRNVIAVSGENITAGETTVLQNVEVISGAAANTVTGSLQGASSYALHCQNCPGLSLIGNIFEAGTGAPGGSGTQPSGEPEKSEAGGGGKDGDPDGGGRGLGGAGGESTCGLSGGAGGLGAERGKNTGVAGGTGSVGTPGGGGGNGGDPGKKGGVGTNGAAGSTGDAGAGATIAHAVAASFWTGSLGAIGSVGNPGNGGGGGGGGGGQGCFFCVNGAGNGGGGGGAGGCGGEGGKGGGTGGGSFGIFLISSNNIVVLKNTVRAVDGGAGGSGSTGGDGGSGGDAGLGSTKATGEIGAGGNGGAGGKGGRGGGGGGGAGGPSVAIFSKGMNASVVNALSSSNTLTIGDGGSGGATPGGSSGAAGAAALTVPIN